ncbi:hypothetical protein TIFTF001_034340 [Ficus carica]|uniref:Uncharacterized protein n=1 Tax=Ficus carica TaxID=3494 RepID=A0AA88J8Z8_FICCA|nr:hypothetical protein TIFTF001_034340 [Ficus carica]
MTTDLHRNHLRSHGRICSSPESRAIARMDLQLIGISKRELRTDPDLGGRIKLYQIVRKSTVRSRRAGKSRVLHYANSNEIYDRSRGKLRCPICLPKRRCQERERDAEREISISTYRSEEDERDSDSRSRFKTHQE